jgi:phenylacetate-CoA ligase
MDVERLYLRMPEIVQNAAILAEGYRINKRRYGSGYDELFEHVQAMEKLSKTEVDSWRAKKLSAFLQAASASPYWMKKFADYDLNLSSNYSFDELKKLPLMTKDDVRDNFSKIVSPLYPRNKTIVRHTSGSTGSGMVFRETRDCERLTWSFWWRYRKWHGIDRRTWCGYFGGRSIVSLRPAIRKLWKTNIIGRQVLFSSYHLSEATLPLYLNAIRDHKLPWLHGYPSTLVAVAQFAKSLNIKIDLPCLKIITTGAENLSSWQRRVLNEAFSVPVVQHYGQAEAVSNISECPLGKLHVDEEYSFTEFVGSSPFGEKTIVGTNWSNPAFPLIRYDSGDLATLDDKGCSCGRNGRLVKEIDGRKEDYLTLSSGAKVGRLDHIFKDMVNVRAAQFRQRSLNDIELRLVTISGYSIKDEKALLGEISKRLGDQHSVKIRYVDEIEKTKSGKLRLVKSDIH